MVERPCACAETPSASTNRTSASALPAGAKFTRAFFIRQDLRALPKSFKTPAHARGTELTSGALNITSGVPRRRRKKAGNVGLFCEFPAALMHQKVAR